MTSLQALRRILLFFLTSDIGERRKRQAAKHCLSKTTSPILHAKMSGGNGRSCRAANLQELPAELESCAKHAELESLDCF